MKLLWSSKAREDLRLIIEIISRDKKETALKWAEELYKKTKRLQRFPHSGRVVPELGRSEIREVLAGNYRIIYKLGKEISILTVFHGAKNLY